MVNVKEDFEWDAGEMGCGELVMKLRIKMKEMKPGQCIKVTAEDAGAPEDMPAWCKLTGNQLVQSAHPDYWIKKKEES